MKYRKNVILTYESLKEALKLPKEVHIKNVFVTEKDTQRETITIALMSDRPTDYTVQATEGTHIPYEYFDNFVINK